MQAALARRIDDLVELGWEPSTTTETSATLHGRRPFSWWLFLFVVIFFPFFGGILYLIFWLATSRAELEITGRSSRRRSMFSSAVVLTRPIASTWAPLSRTSSCRRSACCSRCRSSCSPASRRSAIRST